ncbi:Amino Acid-Polyamine-Organocation (APC) Family [Thraustotheca clavata]|uniref:Amino Acid-Polyamine-Organocation (APC) Family n=1 Tax=Thraustotheca clavata TaxID=74557 RepID=A0A1V9ZC39_9STRA|nr:Amino Acid-Polyamine-Organocation (APC) Family [Thraustotheca clavata]
MKTTGPTMSSLQYTLTVLDIWALGITIVIGGQYFSWNAGLSAGIASYAIGIALVGSAYICLILSMAEMTSTLAFSGGAYGLARCSLGFYAAWVIGCCEILEYIAYTSSSVMSLANMILSAFPSVPTSYAPLFWFITYAVCNVLLMLSDQVFWRFNRVLAIISIGLVVVYVIGSLEYISYSDIPSSSLTRGGSRGFFEALPVSAWFFVGIEALNTVSNVVNNPKEIIPAGQISCLGVLVISAILVFIVTLGLTPSIDDIISDVAVFNRGYQLMFNISPAQATMLSIPATFATIFGFILAYSNIIAAMSSSKLLPLILAAKQREDCSKHPYAALVGSIIGFGMCFLVDNFDTLRSELFNLCMTFAFTAYSAQCIGYVYLKHRFSHLTRSYRSPLGVVGAGYALTVWMINLVAVFGFQDNIIYKSEILLVLLVLLTMYYFGYAKYRQQMSEDEQKVLFFAHVANANDAKRKKHHTTSSGYTDSVSHAFDVVRAFARRHSGITIVFGGQYFSWNAGLSAGIVSYAFGIALVGSAYICLILSMVEMTSTLAFSGGAYGLARCSLGFYAGWVIDCCEIFEYIAYTSSSVMSVANMILSAFLQFLQRARYCVYWSGHFVCNWVSELCFIYQHSTSFTRGGSCGFLVAMPVSAWFFVGVEALSTVSNVVNDPRVIIPAGQIWSNLVYYGLTPNIDSIISDVAVFNRGYQRMFNIQQANATMLSIPAIFAKSLVASSRLLPLTLAAKRREDSSKHRYAALVGSIIGFGMCFLVNFAILNTELFNLCMAFAFTAQCIGYVYLKHRFGHLHRAFKKSTRCDWCRLFICGVVTVLGFQDNIVYKIEILATLLAILTVYYYGYAKSRQKMSDDEQILLFAHVANANDAKRKRRKNQSSNYTESVSRAFEVVLSLASRYSQFKYQTKT